MRIKKIAPVTPANGNIENSYGTSQENTYSQEYQNEHNVVVSSTQPTTSERVWFKKTRNVWQLPDTNTINGVTLTNNGDGTITLNGTATANADFYVSVNSSDYQNGINYYLSSNINSSDITLIIANYNGNTYVNSMVNSNQQMPFTMNITNDKLRFIIRALSGKTFNNTIIKIQLEKGNEATSWNSVYMQPSINVDNEEIYSTPVILFNSSTTDNSITLSDNINNYNYYEIIFHRGNGYSSVKMSTTQLTNISLMTGQFASDLYRLYNANISISGTTLTKNYARYVNFTTNSCSSADDISNFYIDKVIGYK